jgi:uncharacterized membrane protein
MKSKAVLLGHPMHPMLIPFPFAFLTGTLVFDAAGWIGDAPSLWITVKTDLRLHRVDEDDIDVTLVL